jgi:uncharacterized protein (DUF1015 family)
MILSEDELAKKICDDFEVNQVAFDLRRFQEKAAIVVYYESALIVVKETPFRPDHVQDKVVTFLETKLLQAREELLYRPLKHIRETIRELEGDD